jgi:hypothetical protein
MISMRTGFSGSEKYVKRAQLGAPAVSHLVSSISAHASHGKQAALETR